MAFELPKLPYEMEALQPHISKETLEFHYGKHHKTYVEKLNGIVDGKPEANKSLEEIIVNSSGPTFNNAAQIWNHTFYWNSLSPNGGGEPQDQIGNLIQTTFGSFDQFKEEFTKASINLFGSGWSWLVQKEDKSLAITTTKDADNPLTKNQKPLLTCDVWEHAYYIDYRNARPKYMEAYWNLVNWEFANKLLGQAAATIS